MAGIFAQGDKNMIRVIVESPFASLDPKTHQRNVEYARAALLDSLNRGEAPIASHLLYPQVLDDTIPSQRQLGIDAGLAWRTVAEKAVYYLDGGMSHGMASALIVYKRESIPVEYRTLPDWSNFNASDSVLKST